MNRKQKIALWVGVTAFALAILFPFRWSNGAQGWIPRPIFTDGPPSYPDAKQFRDAELLLIVVVTGAAVASFKGPGWTR